MTAPPHPQPERLPTDFGPLCVEAENRFTAQACNQGETGRLELGTHIWAGVCFAGGAYPLLLGMLILALGGFLVAMSSLPGPSAPGVLLEVVGIIGMTAAITSALAAGVCLVVALLLLFLVSQVLKLLRWTVSWPSLGAFVGGLTGFLCLAPFGYSECVSVLAYPSQLYNDLGIYLTATALGPMLAIFCGQVGGAFGGYTAARESERGEVEPAGQHPKRFSFSIRQLLGVTVVLSLLMAVLRLTGLLTSATLLLIAGWLLWQTLSRRPAMWLARRWNRERRQVLQPVPPNANSGGSPSDDVGGRDG